MFCIEWSKLRVEWSLRRVERFLWMREEREKSKVKVRTLKTPKGAAREFVLEFFARATRPTKGGGLRELEWGQGSPV